LFEAKYVEKEIQTLKRKRLFEKYGIIVFVFILFGILIYINYLLGHFNDLSIG
jgi:ATP/ADP translocase